MLFLLAAIPWVPIGVIFTAAVTLITAFFTFTKGIKSDKALESSSLVATAFEGQKNLVEALQEEITRHAAASAIQAADTFKCRQECDELKSKFARTDFELQQAKREIGVLKRRLKDAGISV